MTLFVWLLVFPIPALRAQQRLLNDVNINQEGNCAIVRVNFSFPLRYVNHFPLQSGDDLRIKFEPIAISPQDRNALFKRETITPPTNNVASVSQVIYEGVVGGPFLTLFFEREVGFKVKQGKDFRSLVIGVHDPGKPEIQCEGMADASEIPASEGSKEIAQKKTPTGSSGGSKRRAGTSPRKPAGPSVGAGTRGGAEVEVDLSNRYAINLFSDVKPIDPGSIPMLPVFGRYRLYLTRFERHGTLWHRLRLGFFASKKAAAEVARSLQGTFKGAWVTVVSREERESSAQSAVAFATPTDQNRRAGTGSPGSGPATTDRSNAPSPQSKERVAAAAPKTQSAVPSNQHPAEAQGGSGTEISDARLEALMQEAAKAVTDRDYRKAIQYYTKVLEYPDHKFRQNALEFLGLARERNGQLAQARAEYEKYLRLYPEGEAADRVRQRLAGIVTARAKPKEKLGDVKESSARTNVYGTISQFYNRSESFTDVAGNVVNQNSISNDLDLIIKRKAPEYAVSYVLTGGYAYDFLDGSDSVISLTQSYVDLFYQRWGVSSRLGRQSHSKDGVLGRFDGGVVSYQFFPWAKVNGLAGILLDSTNLENYDSDRYFFGASIDLGTFANHWNFNVFTNLQENDGVTDRQAVGGEVRFFHPKGSAFGFIDYDVSYDELTTGVFVGNWTLPDNTTVNVVADYRKSPILTTNNALIGQTVTSLSELLATLTEDQIRDLARDRTASTTTITVGATRPFNSKFQLHADFTASELTGTPASGGVDAVPGTGWEFFYSSQIIGSSLIKEGDVSILGLRYSNTNTFNTFLMDVNTRYPLLQDLRFNPRMVITYSAGKGTTGDQLRFRPTLTMDYYWKRRIRFEMNSGIELRPDWVSGQTDSVFDYFVNLGYRWNF